MTHRSSMAALLVAGILWSQPLTQADEPTTTEPATLPVAVTDTEKKAEETVTSQPAEPTTCGGCDACRRPVRRGLFHRILRKRFPINACARPFVLDCVRYEPKLRDIRDVPRSHQLPGYDSGIPETLPVLPFYANGYFQLPVR